MSERLSERMKGATAEHLRSWLKDHGYGPTQLPILNFGGAIHELADAMDDVARLSRELDAARAALAYFTVKQDFDGTYRPADHSCRANIGTPKYEVVRLAHEGAPKG